MNLFVADPDWGWWIVGYFFLGGIAAGCYFVASFLDLFGNADDQPLARLGYRSAFPLVLVCGLFLILDLNRPERFWHMLLQSEVVHEALEQGWPWSAGGWEWMVYAPLLKEWSPMSIGAWAIFVFGGFSFVTCWASAWPAGRVARLLNRRGLRWPWRLAGSGVGFFVASYTGVLLTATNQPLWSQTDWLGALFLCSATSTALAALVLLGHRRQHEAMPRIDRIEIGAVCLELVVFVIFVTSLRPWLPALLAVPMGWLLVCAPLAVGMVMPLGLRLGWFGARLRRPLLQATLVLFGGFLLRYAVVMTPPALLEDRAATAPEALPGAVRTPTGWFAVSPEDGRPRGAGPGASAVNRAPESQPRSKVMTEE